MTRNSKIESLILSLLLILSLSVKSQPGNYPSRFILKGSISGMDEKYIFLNYRNSDGNYTKDSALVINQQFQISGNLCEPTVASITDQSGRIKSGSRNFAFLYIEPAKMQITLEVDKFREFKLKGSKTHDEEQVLKKTHAASAKHLKELNKDYNILNDLYISKEKKGEVADSLKIIADQMSDIREQMTPFLEQSFVISKAFYGKYPNSFVTLNKLNNTIREFTYQELMDYYNKMDSHVRNSIAGKEFKINIDKLNQALPGKAAPGFATIEVSGDSLKLSDYKGKYVLLDFWATWCKPCRAGNPELIKLYNKYKNKGIEFIGIADDDRRPEAWKKAIEKDGISIWKHILRGRITETNKNHDLNYYYFISGLPTKILIDPNGVIIGRYGSGGNDEDEKMLPQKLASLFELD